MRTVRRTDKADVTVAAPPSKAHTLRALFLSALADGESTIRNPLLGDDQRLYCPADVKSLWIHRYAEES